MKRGRLFLFACGVGGIGAAAVLAACVDLFHSTSFQTLCDVDASAPGCGAVDGGPVQDAQGIPDATPEAGPQDFCALDEVAADRAASYACAWLGACEGPYEHNPFGQCILEALQAFDCTVRPNMKVTGSIFEYWSCLSKVKSCAEVDSCVKVIGCGGGSVAYNACAGNTRVACAASTPKMAHPPFAANCEAQGRRCFQPDPNDSVAYCAASSTANDAGCSSGCQGSVLHDCEDAGLSYALDLGRDCANVGAGTCTTSDAGESVCAPKGHPCTNGSIVCSSNMAIDCRSGFEDRVDCGRLAGTCTTTGLTGPAWDPASACVGGLTCGPDTCTGTRLNGCANGIAHSVDCKTLGFSGCAASAPVPVGPDYDPTEVRAACKP